MDQSHRPAPGQAQPAPQSAQAPAPGLEDQGLYGNAFLQQQLDTGAVAADGAPNALPATESDDGADDASPGSGLGQVTALAAGKARSGAKTKIESVVDTTYNITGRTLQDVVTTIDAAGEPGHLSWNADVKVGSHPGGRARNVTLTVTRKKRMPVWSNYAKAPESAKAEWKRFHTALDAHENGHATLAKNGWANFADQMEGQPRRTAMERYNKRWAKVAADDTAYDTRTNHGKNKGALLDAKKDPRSSKGGAKGAKE